MPISLKIQFSNKIEELEKISELFEEFCEQNEISSKVTYSLQVVLDELLSNTILYGFSEGEIGKIEIDLKLTKKFLKVKISDNGKNFNPFDAQQPDLEDFDIENKKIGGLGIHIVKKMTDSFEYKRTKTKNIITLSKKI